MLKVNGITCELNYLFCAIFDSGATVIQPPDDRSVLWTEEAPRSAWHDVAQAIERGEVLRYLSLVKADDKTKWKCITVSFPDLGFDVRGFRFRAHEGQEVFNARPVYCRRRSVDMNMDGVAKNHQMRFRIGWQGNLGPEPGAANIERIMEIDNV